mmetsp:Transcript_84448/g.225658  ORF Transcript_84448/g.225658 Transcript_84448/m.225658 type:complete len:208 (+) Transcript_84448:1970-2593(+)
MPGTDSHGEVLPHLKLPQYETLGCNSLKSCCPPSRVARAEDNGRANRGHCAARKHSSQFHLSPILLSAQPRCRLLLALLLQQSSGSSSKVASARSLDPDCSFPHPNKTCPGHHSAHRRLNHNCCLPTKIKPTLLEQCFSDCLQQADSCVNVSDLRSRMQSSPQLRHMGKLPASVASPRPLNPHGAVETIQVPTTDRPTQGLHLAHGP